MSIETLLFYDGFPKIGLWKIWLPKPAPKVGGFGEEENQPPKQAVRPKYTPMLSQTGKILEERSSNLADAHSLKERAEVDVEEKIQSNRRRQRTVHNQGSEIFGREEMKNISLKRLNNLQSCWVYRSVHLQ